MHRAYSLLTVKAVDEEQRVIEGVATTPTTDRLGDIVEPEGAQFDLPLPFLWQHQSAAPIGHVVAASVSDDGIAIKAKISRSDEEGTLKDRLDEAWQSIKLGLVRGLSIGFRALESARIEGTFGYRFIKWDWYELSAVTIPANPETAIQTIKSIDRILLAASGNEKNDDPEKPGDTGATDNASRVVRLHDPARDRAEPYVIRQIKRLQK